MIKILVFTEGTILMHSSAQGVIREERVRQSLNNDPSLNDFAHYIPIGKAVDILKEWKRQGVEIHYITSRTSVKEIENIKAVLTKYAFPDIHHLHARLGKQTYAHVAEEVRPGILIEDDCESIGGEAEMIYPQIKEDLKPFIKAVVVKEFGGIDTLPKTLSELGAI